MDCPERPFETGNELKASREIHEKDQFHAIRGFSKRLLRPSRTIRPHSSASLRCNLSKDPRKKTPLSERNSKLVSSSTFTTRQLGYSSEQYQSICAASGISQESLSRVHDYLLLQNQASSILPSLNHVNNDYKLSSDSRFRQVHYSAAGYYPRARTNPSLSVLQLLLSPLDSPSSLPPHERSRAELLRRPQGTKMVEG